MIIGIVAGEASGDLLGAGLIKALKETHPDIQFVGIGGPHMLAAGCQSLYDIEKLSVMGLIEPLLHLPELIKIRRGLYQYFTHQKPDLFIGIDSPDFNLGLELNLHRAGIRTMHYVSPSVWAWRKKRVFKIKKAVDKILTLFPFETKIYEENNVPVKFVGHPLADTIPLQPNKMAARKALNLDPSATYVTLLPGSRRHEIKYLAETFIATAYRCWKARPHLKFLTSAANEKRNNEFQEYCRQLAPSLPIHFFERRSHDVMAAADVVLVTSGTATLETMLFKKPMAIVYRTKELTFQLAKRILQIKYIGLPNLLANELLVPEFIQDAANPEKISDTLLDFIDHPEKMQQIENKFMEIHLQLRKNASIEAAKAVVELVTDYVAGPLS